MTGERCLLACAASCVSLCIAPRGLSRSPVDGALLMV